MIPSDSGSYSSDILYTSSSSVYEDGRLLLLGDVRDGGSFLGDFFVSLEGVKSQARGER